MGTGTDLVGEPCFADARFAEDQKRPPASCKRALEPSFELGDLTTPADERLSRRFSSSRMKH